MSSATAATTPKKKPPASPVNKVERHEKDADEGGIGDLEKASGTRDAIVVVGSTAAVVLVATVKKER